MIPKRTKKLMGALLSAVLGIAVLFSGFSVGAEVYEPVSSYTNPSAIRQVPSGRGLVAMCINNGIYLSWKLFPEEDNVFGTSEANVSFNIYRDNRLIATESNTTNYFDVLGTIHSQYSVAPVINGIEGKRSSVVKAFESGSNYFDIPLQKPADCVLEDGNIYSYSAGDASCGDIDGDGEYEIILKWDCNPKDNSHSGYSGNVLLDAYKLDGTFLWRIDLGRNIRAGAHYTQFLVYDFDQDGKDEITCKTAPGSKDGKGNYVTAASRISSIVSADNSAVYLNDGGYVLTGPEYFTIFNGEDGAAIDTIYYPTERVSVTSWGDNYGNRCDRYLATVAWLDGQKPYAVYWRGYYSGQKGYSGRTGIAGISFNGERLSVDYIFDTLSTQNGYTKGNENYIGQGNHNITAADVDGDGKDEVISGALCFEVNNNNKLAVKWCSWRGHGDALHIGDYDPTHAGYEYFSVHEGGATDGSAVSHGKVLDFGMTVYDAATGDELKHVGASGDTGRGVMADVGAGGYYQFWGAGAYKAMGNGVFEEAAINGASSNFRIFWDGDLYDELLDGTNITSWDGSKMTTIFSAKDCMSINGTKANPVLQADLFGDWREEVIYPIYDNSALRVFTTDIYTGYKMKTLMSDNVYRSGVAAEQTAYNQPPHIGYYVQVLNANEPKEELTKKTITASDTAYLDQNNSSTSSDEIMYLNTYGKLNGYALMKFDIAGLDMSSLYSAYLQVYTTNIGKDRSGMVTISEINTNWSNADSYSSINYSSIIKNTIIFRQTNTTLMFPVFSYSNIDITDYLRTFKGDILGMGISANYAADTTFAGVNSAHPPRLVLSFGNNKNKVELEFLDSSDNSPVSGFNLSIQGIRTTSFPKKSYTTDSAGKIEENLFNGTYLIVSESKDYSPIFEIITVKNGTFTETYLLNQPDRYANSLAIKSDSLAYPGRTFYVSATLRDQFNQVLTDGVTYLWSVSDSSLASITDDGKVTISPNSGTGVFDIICSATYNGDTLVQSCKVKVTPKMKDRVPQFYVQGTLNEIPTNETDIDNRDSVKTPTESDFQTGITSGTICFDFDFRLEDGDEMRWSACGRRNAGTLGPEFYFTARDGYVTVQAGPSASTLVTKDLKTGTWYKASVSSKIEEIKTASGTNKYNPNFEMYIYEINENGDDGNLLAYSGGLGGRNLASTERNEIFSYIHFYNSTGKPYIDNVYVYRKLVVKDLSLISAPVKTSYYLGEELDTTGLVLTATYDDNTTQTITDGYVISGYDSSVTGPQEITVTYGGRTVTFTVTVIEKTLTGIEVKAPVKTEYIEGQPIELDGMKVTAVYNNGTREELNAADYNVTGYNSTVIGEQTITVSYKGKTAIFKVTVIAKKLTGIKVTAPTKTEYNKGEGLDTAGMTITVSYDNGTTELITEGYTIQGYDSMVPGTQTVTVLYGGYSDTFTVTVTSEPFAEIIENTLKQENGIISGQIKANINVSRSSDVHDVRAVLAIYEYGKLVDIQCAYVNIKKGDNDVTFAVNGVKASTFTAKLFVWDSMDKLTPFAKALAIQ